MADVVASSTIGADRYAELAYTYSARVEKTGVGTYRYISQSFRTSVLSTDSTLISADRGVETYHNYDINESGVRIDRGTVFGAAWFGGQVTIDLPNLGQSLDFADWLSEFVLTISLPSKTESNCTIAVGGSGQGGGYGDSSAAGAGCRPTPPSGFLSDLICYESYLRYPCPVIDSYPALVSSKEHFVHVGRDVCAAGYTDTINAPITVTGWPLASTDFLRRVTTGAAGGTYTGLTLKPVGYPAGGSRQAQWQTNFINANQGRTVNLSYWAQILPAVGITVTISEPPGTPFFGRFDLSYSVTVRRALTGFRHHVLMRTAGDAGGNLIPPPTIASAEFRDIVAWAWFGAIAGGVKPLYVSIQRGAQKNIGAGSGATTGHDTYTYSSTIDERSELGLVFMPGGDLVMSFDTYAAGGVKTAKYVRNRQFGLNGGWSATANVTPNVAQALQSGRAQAQGMRVRVGS